MYWPHDALYFLNLSWFPAFDFIKNVKYACEKKFPEVMCAKTNKNYKNKMVHMVVHTVTANSRVLDKREETHQSDLSSNRHFTTSYIVIAE